MVSLTRLPSGLRTTYTEVARAHHITIVSEPMQAEHRVQGIVTGCLRR